MDHPLFGIQIDDIDREFHPDRVDALRGRDPKPFTRLKVLGLMAEQTLHSGPRGIRKLDLGGQHGFFAAIQQLILQRLPRLRTTDYYPLRLLRRRMMITMRTTPITPRMMRSVVASMCYLLTVDRGSVGIPALA